MASAQLRYRRFWIYRRFVEFGVISAAVFLWMTLSGVEPRDSIGLGLFVAATHAFTTLYWPISFVVVYLRRLPPVADTLVLVVHGIGALMLWVNGPANLIRNIEGVAPVLFAAALTVTANMCMSLWWRRKHGKA